MVAGPQGVKGYECTSNDQLFLDTNIWLMIFCPRMHTNFSRSREHIYTSAWGRMLEGRGRIYTNILVVSEFINTYARIKFKPVARDIAKATGKILCHCIRISDSSTRLDMDALRGEFSQGNADFNAPVIRETCKKRNLTLVTDDADFAHQGIPLLTADRRLLG